MNPAFEEVVRKEVIRRLAESTMRQVTWAGGHMVMAAIVLYLGLYGGPETHEVITLGLALTIFSVAAYRLGTAMAILRALWRVV